MAKKVIVFDLDGVLVDSKEAHAEAFNLAFDKNKLPRQPKEKIWRLFGPPGEVIIGKLFPGIPYKKLAMVIKDKDDILVDNTFKLAKPIQGVNDVVLELSKDWMLAVVSNAEHGEIYILLRQAGINPRLFDAIIGSDDIKKHKPDPAPVKKVEEVLKSKVECVVGDQTVDIEMGKAAEVKTVAVLSGMGSAEQLSSARPDILIRNLSLLPESLREEI